MTFANPHCDVAVRLTSTVRWTTEVTVKGSPGGPDSEAARFFRIALQKHAICNGMYWRVVLMLSYWLDEIVAVRPRLMTDYQKMLRDGLHAS